MRPLYRRNPSQTASPALHCRIERADPGFVAMHQLPVDVYDQVAVSLIKFLKHVNSYTDSDVIDADAERGIETNAFEPAFLTSDASIQIRDLLQAVFIEPLIAFRGSAREFQRKCFGTGSSFRTDTAETMSILPLRRTNASPRLRRFRAIPAARTASIR